MRAHRDWFDTCEEEFNTAVATIATIDEPVSRIEQGLATRNASLAVYYKELPERLRGPDSLLESDLLPSDLCSLLRHFRLPDHARDEELAFSIDHGCTDLLFTEGLEEGLQRIFHLPVPLCPSVLGAVKALSGVERKRLIKTLLRLPFSPLSRFHILRLVVDAGEAEPLYLRLARRMVFQLSTGAFTNARALLKMVAWAVQKIEQSHHTSSWPSSLRLTLAWAHASRLYSLYQQAGASSEWLHAAFRARTGQFLPNLETEWRRYSEVLDTNNVSPETLLVTGLGYALAGKPAETILSARARETLTSCLIVHESSVTAPTTSLLRDPTLLVNASGSFLGRDPLDDMVTLLGPQFEVEFSAEWRQRLVASAVRELSGDWRSMTGWAVILAVTGGAPARGATGEAIDGAWTTHCLIDLFRGDEGVSPFILKAAAVRIQHVHDASTRESLKQQLLEIAAMLSDPRTLAEVKGRFANEDPVILLLNLFLGFDYPSLWQSQAADEFIALGVQLAERCPPLASPMRTVVERFCWEMPVTHSLEFWLALLQLRALP